MQNQQQIETWIQNELELVLLEPLICLQESEVSVWLQGRTQHLEMFVKVSPQSAQLEGRVGRLLTRFAPGLTPEILGFNNNLGVVVTRKLEAGNLSFEQNTEIWLESGKTATLEFKFLDRIASTNTEPFRLARVV
jgi:hypothetical protein